MQIVFQEDNLHEISNLIFWKKKYENYHIEICWICPESANVNLIIPSVLQV